MSSTSAMFLHLVSWVFFSAQAMVQAQPSPPLSRDISELDIQLVNGSVPNEGRVLIRWSHDSPPAAVCYNAFASSPSVYYLMCRRLGYQFACGHREAGMRDSTEDPAFLETIRSEVVLGSCYVGNDVPDQGGCALDPIPLIGPGGTDSGSPCTHDQDLWLTCGYADMPNFELRLAGESLYGPGGLLQGRCSPEHEWGAICSNYFFLYKTGRVACRELGYSDYGLSNTVLLPREVEKQYRPNYTLFVDIGCFGNESSLTECLHYSLRGCLGYVRLECFTGTKEFNETAYLCGSKQLCGKTCQQTHPMDTDDTFHYCQCDSACVLFDDCCYDFEDSCPTMTSRLGPATVGFPAEYFSCVLVPGNQFFYTGYVLASRCPITWTDEGTRDLCEMTSLDEDDIIASLPVSDEMGIGFKNLYCAICHGRLFSQLRHWNVSRSEWIRQSSDIKFYPSFNQTFANAGWVVRPPHEHYSGRTCPAHLVDTCRDDFRGSELEAACRAYYAPIKVSNSNARYRNPHCAMCNEKQMTPEHSCRDQVCTNFCDPEPWGDCFAICGPIDRILTIEVLFDFSSESIVTGVSCADGEIYDPFLEKCRLVTCAAGYHIRGDVCVAFVSDVQANTTIAYELECLFSSLGTNGEAVCQDRLHHVSHTLSNSSILAILATTSAEVLELEIGMDNAMKSMQNGSQEDSSMMCDLWQVSIFLTYIPDGSFHLCGNYTTNGIEIFSEFNGTLLTSLEYQYFAADKTYLKSKAPLPCFKILDLNCSAVTTLAVSEYQNLSHGNMEVTATGSQLSPEDYVRFPDSTVAICSFRGPASGGLEPRIRRVVALVGSCLSLPALVATFVTYCIFGELRSTAGKLVMNLVVALFTAILSLLVAGFFKYQPVACTIIAVLAHFTWLAAFFCMTSIAAYAARTLTSVTAKNEHSTGLNRKLISCLALTWGLPLIIISICLIIQFCNCPSIPVIYAENGTCWITNQTARLAAFVGPVVASLLLNVIFYIKTLASLRLRRQATKIARRQGKLTSLVEELTIYAKLCTLMGVTWVFGVLSQSVTNILVFSYIYIILNYLQGVFIFFGFCLNKRVRGLWKTKLRRQTKQRRDGTDASNLTEKSYGLRASSEQNASACDGTNDDTATTCTEL